MAAKKKLYSYIRKPYSSSGWYGMAAAVVSFVSAQIVAVMAVRTNGDMGTAGAAAGACSLLFAAAVLPFTVAGILDRESNRTFVFAALAIAVVTLAQWALMLNIQVLIR